MDTSGGQIPTTQLRFERITGGDGDTCLSVIGEIDMTTGEHFRQTLVRILYEPGIGRLLLDFAHLGFMDSTGVGVLVKAQQIAAEQGIAFGIVNAQRPVHSVLTMMGVYKMLSVKEHGT
jgi:anti-anti-sigma factor